MNRIGSILVAVVLCGGMALAQAAPAPSTGTAPSAQKTMRQQRRAERQQAMQQHMQEAQAKIDKLKADIDKVSDPATKQALQDNADMWQMMFDHMKSMAEGGGMHGGMMRHHGMGKGMGMGQGNPPASNPNPGEPPAQNPK